ncbi:MAG: sulfatase [Flavobacteriaceae bacterium]
MKYHFPLIFLITLVLVFESCDIPSRETKKQPNILIAIADDQSYPHTGVYGFAQTKTPAFDFVAENGTLFHNAFVAAPQCSPSRAAILTGKNIWELEEAGTHASNFPIKHKVFTEVLEEQGYHVGYTGKPWAPGNWKISGRKQNPVGKAYNRYQLQSTPTKGIRTNDYAKNFEDFMDKKEEGSPFVFWYGAFEPHRVYEYESGKKSGKSLDAVSVPEFLPDTEKVRNDILDYILEIEHFDQHLHRMLKFLEKKGELDNTFVLVTSDNGMPFPYAKANVQEFGTHVPLAIYMPEGVKAKEVFDPVGMIDLAPTLMDLVGLPKAMTTSGKSLLPVLTQDQHPIHREYVLTGRERHTHARPDNLGYPARAIRTRQYLYVHHFKPDRWPQGDPVPQNQENDQRSRVEGFKNLYPGYHDVDPSPSKDVIMVMKDSIYFELAFAKRPMQQLYDIQKDPYCTQNIALLPEYKEVLSQLKQQLFNDLKEQGDPRVFDNPVFDSYPRYSTMRNFPGFNQRGQYNAEFAQ